MEALDFMQMPASIEAPTTYMALGSVLAVLLFLTLWREMSTTKTSEFFPRSFAALSFVGHPLAAESLLPLGSGSIGDHPELARESHAAHGTCVGVLTVVPRGVAANDFALQRTQGDGEGEAAGSR